MQMFVVVVVVVVVVFHLHLPLLPPQGDVTPVNFLMRGSHFKGWSAHLISAL